jgi:hypothetical protein
LESEQEVRAAMEAYQAAYKSENLDGMLAVFPGMRDLDRAAYRAQFKYRIKVTFGAATPVITDDYARISVAQQLILVIHGMAQSPNVTTHVFTLKKTQGRWLITSIE